METLSKLIRKARQLIPDLDRYNLNLFFRSEKGYCVICGEYWQSGGFQPTFGNNFTSFELLQGGNIICPYCNLMRKSQDYRHSMWLVTPNEWRPFKKKDAKKILLEEKEIPFALYFTKTWKKQGWINMMHSVNYSNQMFFVGFDYERIAVNIEEAKSFFELIEKLRELKISKYEIESGKLKPKSLLKLNLDKDVVHALKMNSEDPLWRLCVYVNE